MGSFSWRCYGVAMERILYFGPILVRGLFFFWPIKKCSEKERIKKELRKSTSECGKVDKHAKVN